jgi:hypothetical protein
MRFPIPCHFTDRLTGERVRGLILLATEGHLLEWREWHYSPDDEDRDWDWWSIYLECRLSEGRYECFAAVAANGLQGLMLLDVSPSEVKRRQGIIVDYLSTNPSNRSSRSGLKHVGVALLAVSMSRSVELGRGGRIWLESLPAAEGFYKNLGMRKQPRLSSAGNPIYVLNIQAAKELLEEIREKGIVAV